MPAAWMIGRLPQGQRMEMLPREYPLRPQSAIRRLLERFGSGDHDPQIGNYYSSGTLP